MDDHQSADLPHQPLRQRKTHIPGSFDWRKTEGKVRNISGGNEGLPLVLRLALVDAMTGEPVVGAQVRIEQNIGADSLCGAQSTDSQGIVRFTSIYPDQHSGGASCIAMTVCIASDDQHPQSHQEAWAGRLHLPDVCSCETAGDDASRLVLRPIGGEGLEDGYFGSLTIGVDTFAVSSQIGLAGYEKSTGAVF
ncbi:peptidase associated/transthyretin-like domain-containing protein [Pseudomonas sp. R84]|uniref:hypothetical protein n=1 Tax=Pseudomonas sp. R84 TaxID=1573712 RepID=UPI0013201303|nr:hypothetical protein [Pseudomonas sp. R84]QHC97268.1 hypothetical protein PspR84_22405 [Pseudomonas sp. R84]